jgi:hypothetical protein
LTRSALTPMYRSMKSNVIVASTLAVLTAGGLVGEAVISAESAETHCAAPTSCTERPAAVEPWSPDMPEHDNAALAPTVQLVETSGAASASSLPPGGWLDDTAVLRRHWLPQRRAAVYSDDEGWLAYAATQASARAKRRLHCEE